MTIVDYPAYIGAKTCRAKNDFWFYLNAFYIDTKGFIVSTDGHRMFTGKCQTNHATGFIAQVNGKEPAKFSHAEFSVDDKKVSFYGACDVLISVLPFDVLDANYPDWRRVAESHTPGKVDVIGVAPAYLADLTKIHKAYGKKSVVFKFQDQLSSIRIPLSDTDYVTLMPQRV